MRINEFNESQQRCPKCGGPSFSDLVLAEKQDACYNKVKSRYKVWPSAYASGALVQCRKKGAANWGNKSEGVAEVQLTPLWQDDPEHLEYRKKQADISRNTGLAVGDLVTLKDRPGFEGKIVRDWGGGDFTISGSGGGMSQSNNHRANARNIQKLQGVAEGYPKHQDLSGISTDKLKAYLDKQSKQQVSGEGNQVKRVRAELQRRQQGVAEAKAATASFRAGNKKRAELNSMSDEERRAYDKEQQEKQRERDDARLERERQKKKGVAEGLPQTLRKVVPGHAKREIDRKMDAGKFGKTDADKDANFQRYKKIQDKLKEQGVAEGFNPEYDDEAGMADNNLSTLRRAVEGLDDLIDSGDNLPEWCQEKIAVAKSMLVSVWDYMESNDDAEEEFDLIESTVDQLAAQNGVDAEMIWEDLESLSHDELYVFAVTSQLNEDWSKVNKRDKTDGMSQKAVNAYRRENPGSKLKTAVTTKPSKLKKGSKASKRRKSYCSRSRGQMKMHNISCAKTPDKAICKARRRWNC